MCSTIVLMFLVVVFLGAMLLIVNKRYVAKIQDFDELKRLHETVSKSYGEQFDDIRVLQDRLCKMESGMHNAALDAEGAHRMVADLQAKLTQCETDFAKRDMDVYANAGLYEGEQAKVKRLQTHIADLETRITLVRDTNQQLQNQLTNLKFVAKSVQQQLDMAVKERDSLQQQYDCIVKEWKSVWHKSQYVNGQFSDIIVSLCEDLRDNKITPEIIDNFRSATEAELQA
jgi:chromosome segregation ATPase